MDVFAPAKDAVATFGNGSSIRAFGASTSLANNATAIQAAIDKAALNGGGRVIVPAGVWKTGPLVMKTGVHITGESEWSTRLQLIDNANTHMVTLETVSTMWTGFSYIALDGNKANQTTGDVIHYFQDDFVANDATTILAGDTNHYLHRVILTKGKGSGFYHRSNNRGAIQALSVLSYHNDTAGFWIESPDNHFDHCVAAGSGLQGFYIPGNQNRLVGCKAFISGQVTATQGVGFDVHGDRNDLIHVEAQENRSHGFVMSNTDDCILIGKAESNGLGAGANPTGGAGDGIYAELTKNCRIDINLTDRKYLGFAVQRWGYNLGSGNDANIVTITQGVNATGTAGIGSWGPNSLVTETFNGKPVPRALAPVPTSNQTGTSYTLASSDAGCVIEGTNAAAQTITVPPNSAVAYPVGTQITLRQMGAGQITAAAGAGVTLRSRGGALKLSGQYAEMLLTKRGTDEWVVSGDITT